MKVGKKLFPYPTLNNYKMNNAYENSSYELKMSGKVETDSTLIIKEAYADIVNEDIERFVRDGRAKAVLIVECSQTTYRKIILLSTEPKDIEISLAELNGTVEISSYVYATQDIEDFSSSCFIEDYKDYSFYIEKYAILAIDDGFKTTVLHEEKKDKKIASIFSVIPNIDDKEEGFIVSSDSDRIVIQMPARSYGFYENLKMNDNFKYMFFGLMGIPALSHCIQEIKDNFDVYNNDLSEVILDKKWFNSVMVRYKRIYNTDLTSETFCELNSYSLAQEMLDYGSTKAIDDMRRMFLFEGGENDD